MSARDASTPSSLRRSSVVRTEASSSITDVSSPRVIDAALSDWGTGSSRRTSARVASASAVPEVTTAMSWSNSAVSADMGATRPRTYARHRSRAPSSTTPSGKKRRVMRNDPSFTERAWSTSPLRPMSTSVDPPPTSMSTIRRSNTGSACSTPSWMSRASSWPEMTCTSTPASSRARRRNSAALVASRTAEVATAYIGASKDSASDRQRSSAATPRSIASGSSCFISPLPEPSRTISF